VISDLDIWRAANLLLKQHGDDAPWIAAQRADELLANGDPFGCETFKKIAKAVDELGREKPTEGEPVN
jgi:hypothetical protein